MYENNKVINEKIEQLSQINNIKKYNTTECKICLNCDVTIALQCGHLLCENCYSNIIKTTNKENYELIGTSNKIIDDMDIIECPVCRTVSTSCIHIYF
jgi:YgiT-type zinc finger domain-containing protein